jgi:hypothetical protein
LQALQKSRCPQSYAQSPLFVDNNVTGPLNLFHS